MTLSHVLRSRARQATHRWDLHDRLIEGINHGALEDHWDTLIYENTGIRDDVEVNAADLAQRNGQGGSKQRPMIRGRGGEAVVEFEGPKGAISWTSEVREALDVLKGALARMGNEREEMARTMKRIMEGERTLAEKEKVERREKARLRWLASTGQDVVSAETAASKGLREREHRTSDVGKVTVSPFSVKGNDIASKNARRFVDFGHGNAPGGTTTTPTSSPRKKTVRRPWDPDWVPKPRRWK